MDNELKKSMITYQESINEFLKVANRLLASIVESQEKTIIALKGILDGIKKVSVNPQDLEEEGTGKGDL